MRFAAGWVLPSSIKRSGGRRRCIKTRPASTRCGRPLRRWVSLIGASCRAPGTTPAISRGGRRLPCWPKPPGDEAVAKIERLRDRSGAEVSPAARQPAVEVVGLNLVFQTADTPVTALSDINLTVNKGDFVSLIGPSGCGKTTLLRVIADLKRATGGSIQVNGVSPEQARLARAYGYVFQAAALYPWRSVLRNVTLPLEIMGLSRKEQLERAARVIELVELTGFERKFPWQLSGGMQQRVSIARALSFDPDLLLMDEPFGALDEIIRDRLNEQLLQLWERTGKTVIFVTH